MLRKLLFLVLVVGVLSAALPIFGIAGAGVTAYTMSCDNILISYGAYTIDRDNTGAGFEVWRFSATDGDGTYLEDGFVFGSVGTSRPAHIDDTISFTIGVADYNPIHVTLISLAGNGFQEQVVWDVWADCPGLPTFNGPGVGPSAPSYFVHRQVVCETPVYNLPGGQQVGDAMIHNLQTWFVSPYPVEDYNGKSWTEIFNAGNPNGFIPTECVNPDPAAVIIKPNLPSS